jgi:hypothetical protein
MEGARISHPWIERPQEKFRNMLYMSTIVCSLQNLGMLSFDKHHMAQQRVQSYVNVYSE